MTIPRTVEEVTPAWLSEVLGTEVVDCQAHYLEGGVVGDAFRIHDIEYAEPSGRPASAVVKLANAIAEKRDYAVENRIYVKEVNFYKYFARDLPLRAPEVYYLESDDEDNCEFFVILMEDLNAHSLVFDQVDDPPDASFTRKISSEVAAFHARFWESEELQLDWLKLPAEGYEFPMTPACRACPETFDVFVPLWEQMFGENPFTEPRWADIAALSDLVTGPKSSQLLDFMNQKLDDRPKTLVHGDIRADNIFRSHPDQGRSVADSQLTYIDWQMLQPGPPGPEFTQFWQHSQPPAVRRHDMKWLREYHGQLVALAPQAASYTYEMLVEDYKVGFVIWWMALMTLGATTIPIFDQPEGQRMKALWGQGLEYSWQAMLDHDCLGMVQQFAAEVG